MNIITVHEYKVDDSLLTPGGFSLEVGMRSMTLANVLIDRGMRHIALEPDPRVSFSSTDNFKFSNEAVVGDENVKEVELIITQHALCNHLNGLSFRFQFGDNGNESGKFKVAAVTLEGLMKRHNVTQFDLIAMDCEGSEESILLAMTNPVSKQISVEFHTHCGQPIETKNKIISHLDSLGYRVMCWRDSYRVEYGLFLLK